MPVTRVKTAGGWVDLAKVGPQGPAGAQGAQGAAGPANLIGSQVLESAAASVDVAMPNGGECGFAGAGSDLRLTCSPAVNAWWDCEYFFGQLNHNVAGWAYAYFIPNLSPGSSPMPAAGGATAYAPGAQLGQSIVHLYGPGGNQYGAVYWRKRFAVSAGGSYALQPVWGHQGNYYFQNGRLYLWAIGSLYAR